MPDQKPTIAPRTRDPSVTTPGPANPATEMGETSPQPLSASASAFLSAPQAADEIGRLGSCRLLRMIGEGGMGYVFEAEDVVLQRRVAVKVMRPEIAAIGGTRARFLREARAAAALRDDHVVPLYHVGEENGVPYLVMPFLPGESLEDRLAREPRLSLIEAVRYARQAAQGLAAAHAAGLIHRDIKPANLWLEQPPQEIAGVVRRSRVRILDFGLARSAADEQMTQSGHLLGTPAYMAPEQARGDPVDFRADLFSLGVVLYELLTGVRPFQGADVWSLLYSLVHDPPTPVQELASGVPDELAALVMKLLEKAPADRQQSAASLVVVLGTIEKRLATPKRALRPSIRGIPANPTAPDPDIATNLQTVANPNTPTIEATKRPPLPEWLARNRYWILTASVLLVGAPLLAVSLLNRPKSQLPPTAPGIVPQILVTAPKSLTFKSGQELTFPVSVLRESVTGEVQLKWLELPIGVRGIGSTSIPEYQDRGQLTLIADASVRGSATANLRACIGDVVDTKSIELQIERVEPPLLDSTNLPVDAATAKKIQQQWADYLGKNVKETIDLANGVKMEFLLIPPGEFMMGAADGEPNSQFDERPRHRRRIERPFYFSKYEVTQEQYQALMGENPSRFPSGTGETIDQLPVERVSWFDAQTFCSRLEAKIGRKARLPTEAQWEYACRAGSNTPFYFGSSLNGDRANVDGNHPYGSTSRGKYLKRTTRVGSYELLAPHPLGLCDMHGNVWEWCTDWYDERFYERASLNDFECIDGERKYRVVRGGSWDNLSRSARSAYRYGFGPQNRGDLYGFRVALPLD